MSNDKIIPFTVINGGDSHYGVQSTLETATNKKPTDVIVIGYDEEGNFFYTASDMDGYKALWLLEEAKHRLVKVALEMSPK